MNSSPKHDEEPAIPEAWPNGDQAFMLSVIKQSPAGEDVAEYPARLLPGRAPAPWIVAEARWANEAVNVAGLWFRSGDRLLEYFSPTEWFNAFAVYDPGGELRGWYANVTRPITYDAASSPPRLTWHDLFVDIVLLPDGALVVLDEDELAASSLERDSPDVYVKVLQIRDRLVALASNGEFPFVEIARD